MSSTTIEMKHGAVTDEFDHAARSYDRLVAANPGYHSHLRASARRLRLPGRGEGLRLLDLGCGTGASTAALLRAAPLARIAAVDASRGMLDAAAAKEWPRGVTFHRARAEEITPAWADEHLGGPADAVFAAYLIRNVPDPDALLASVRSVLRPGGRLALHEYSVADSPAARAVWSAVCWGVVIPAGGALTGRTDLFRYLWRSAMEFDGRAGLLDRMRRAGLVTVASAPLPGWQYGITHTFVGARPLEGRTR
ncbi:class I SAM-dependent methyltransferase [Nocardiopsis sp. NRRL B-16309]|uniref:class I SAM-dependent methyltransferase n=1 Tax=Nocardiopsis sp. NRRL B-16309 TaxID=1519494 RepID=UPI0006AE56B0|nr:class I SAM-dependent methyltransferase [Nocardiopsis sp. NRRL B-16309]KOX22103.1 ubiquinone biosynthesis methyltransferase UbiE [Nocardiopsis sp. NRRL B-16309]